MPIDADDAPNNIYLVTQTHNLLKTDFKNRCLLIATCLQYNFYNLAIFIANIEIICEGC